MLYPIVCYHGSILKKYKGFALLRCELPPGVFIGQIQDQNRTTLKLPYWDPHWSHILLLLRKITKPFPHFLKISFLHNQYYCVNSLAKLAALFPHFLKTHFGSRKSQFFSILEKTKVPRLAP